MRAKLTFMVVLLSSVIGLAQSRYSFDGIMLGEMGNVWFPSNGLSYHVLAGHQINNPGMLTFVWPAKYYLGGANEGLNVGRLYVSNSIAVENGCVVGSVFTGNGSGITNAPVTVLTNGVGSVTPNITITFTNKDGSVYEVAARRIVP